VTPKLPPIDGTTTPPAPPPRPGDILNYVYLFSTDAAAGRDEGVKERPVIVLAADASGIVVAPITTKGEIPDSDTDAIPEVVATAMGLPRPQESYVVLNEANEFDWRGHDVIDLKSGGFLYGRTPPGYFAKIIRAIQARLLKPLDRR
jgi:hypothetical protein